MRYTSTKSIVLEALGVNQPIEWREFIRASELSRLTGLKHRSIPVVITRLRAMGYSILSEHDLTQIDAKYKLLRTPKEML